MYSDKNILLLGISSAKEKLSESENKEKDKSHRIKYTITFGRKHEVPVYEKKMPSKSNSIQSKTKYVVALKKDKDLIPVVITDCKTEEEIQQAFMAQLASFDL